MGPSTDRAPRISVIMPVRDVADWVTQTVESLQAQTLTDWELIAVDDASTDATVEVLRGYGAEDPRIRVVDNPGSGGADARNHAIDLARGEFLAFADGDDLVPRQAYEQLVAQAQSSGAEMVVGNHIVMEAQRNSSRDASLRVYDRVRTGVTVRDVPQVLRDRVCWNRLIRRASWNDLGLRFATSRRSNDIYAMTLAYCSLEFDLIPTPVYAYRRRVGVTSMTSTKLQPDSLRDHFTQEQACAGAVRRLGDAGTLRTYYAQILEFDIWAHGVVAVQRRADPDFDEVRRLLRALVTAAPAASLASLPALKELLYHLIATEAWEFAQAIADDPEVATDPSGPDVSGRGDAAQEAAPTGPVLLARRLRDLDGEEVVAAIAATSPHLRRGLAALVELAFVRPLLRQPYDLDDAAVEELYDEAVRLRDAGDLGPALAPEVQRLLAEPRPPASVIRAAFSGWRPAQEPALRRIRRARRVLRSSGPAPAAVEVLAGLRDLRPGEVMAAARSAREPATQAARSFAGRARRKIGRVRRRWNRRVGR